MDNHEKMLRLVSLENELKNAALCDYVIHTDREDAVERILKNLRSGNPYRTATVRK